MLERLVIGTANWGREYNGHCVDEKEQNLIMEYMKEIGIEWLDVAAVYGTENIGEEFKRFVKIGLEIPKHFCATTGDILISHSISDYNELHGGVSVNIGDKVPGYNIYVEFPYSILYYKIPQLNFHRTIARSIFCKGKALKYFSPRECIDFVLMNPRIDKVILGVDSVDQLKENVAHLVKMEKFEHNEETDTRKF